MALMGSFSSCSDDVTLDGADAVYIDITPSTISLRAGERQRIAARVTNQDGKVIETPILWSVDDESVAKLVPVYRPLPTPDPGTPGEGEGEGEEGGEEPGGDVETQDSSEPTEPTEPTEPNEPSEEQGEFLYYAVEAQAGAQGKSTYLRVQLENGKQAVCPVTVVRGEIKGALTPITELAYSHGDRFCDTIFFKLSSPTILDDYELSVEFVTDPASILDYTYDFPADNIIERERSVRTVDETKAMEFTYFPMEKDELVSGDTLRIRFKGPYLDSKATCRVTLTDPDYGTTEVYEVPVISYPVLSCGFEVDGKRPYYTPSNPSNIKQTMLAQTIDVNSTFDVGLCIGVLYGFDLSRAQVVAAHEAGWFKWEIEGSAVIIEEEYFDLKYDGGVVPYLRVRAGAREGVCVLRYKTPFQTFTCNLSVENYNISHPVESIEVSNPSTGHTYAEGEVVDFTWRPYGALDIFVMPEASYEFHKPEVTVADESILTVNPVGADAGYTREFTFYNEGSTTLTIKALDKTRTVPVTVTDVCLQIDWSLNHVSEVLVGQDFELAASVLLTSQRQNPYDLTWTFSDPNAVSWRVKPDDPSTIIVTPLAAGDISVTASLKGVTSEPYSFTINASQDYNYGDSEDDFWYADASGWLTLGFNTFLDDPDALIITIESIELEGFEDMAGHFTGNDASVDVLHMYNCEYDITITQTREPDGDYEVDEAYWTISGTVTLPNGSKITFNNTIVKVCG